MFNFDDDVFEHTEKLTPAVLQACEMLSMYQAELARVLGLQCADIGRMTSVQQFLIPDSAAWNKAVSFIQFYQYLFTKFNGDEALMVHWLKTDNSELKGNPLLLMVDDSRLSYILKHLSQQS